MARRLLALAVAASLPALAGCVVGESGTGYVQIKTVPTYLGPQTNLYVNAVKLDPIRNGVAVLKERVGKTDLQIAGDGGSLSVLCSVTVRKNRLTTVTVSIYSRPPRCQVG